MAYPRALVLVLLLAVAGCASAPASSDSAATLTVRNTTNRFVKVYTADTPRSVPERLGRLVIGETRTFRLRDRRSQTLLVVFPDGRRIAKTLPAHQASAFEVVIESSRNFLTLSYRR